MGDILVFLTRHAKVLGAWSIIVTAFAAFCVAIERSSAFSWIDTGIQRFTQLFSSALTYVPEIVSQFNSAITAAVGGGDTFGALMFWLCGFDALASVLTFIAAQVSLIISAIVVLVGSALLLHTALFVLRATQRFVVAMTGGDGNGMQVTQ